MVRADPSGALAIRCPVEGRFTGPLELAPELPNPSAGWDFYLEGAPRRMELSAAPTKDGFWLITCHLSIEPNGVLSIAAHMSGRRRCRMVTEDGKITARPDGGEFCERKESGPAASCAVVCQ